MSSRKLYTNLRNSLKDLESRNLTARTMDSVPIRPQSIEQKPVSRKRRPSANSQSIRASYDMAYKGKSRKPILRGREEKPSTCSEQILSNVLAKLNSQHRRNLTASNYSLGEKKHPTPDTSITSGVNKNREKGGFEETKYLKAQGSINSSLGTYAPYPNKNKLMQPARTASFALADRMVSYAVNTTNGLVRGYNEDRVSVVVNIRRKPGWTRWPNCSYFAIFDGHGGSMCADFLKDRLHSFILESSKFPLDPVEALKEGCERAEAEFCAMALGQTEIDRSGSCALILLFVDETLYVANIGDSRAIISDQRGKRICALTRDHKPEDPEERARIKKNGGSVSKGNILQHYKMSEHFKARLPELPDRVYPGGLSLSRSFGDITAKYTELGGKTGVLISTPEIKAYKLDMDKADFIVMGCDGIYDKCSNEEIVKLVWRLKKNEGRGETLEGLVDGILEESMRKLSYDNLTAILIDLKSSLYN